MTTAKSDRMRCLIIALMVVGFLLSGCPEFKSIEQPSSVSPGESFTVSIEAMTRSNEYEEPIPPYFGICLPQGWTISGDAIACTGAYNEVITYDPNLALEQEALSPSPEGYYWWVGVGNGANAEGSVYGEIQIQTGSQLGLYSIDYMLGNSHDGLNQDRSDNHLICIVDEYTPRGLKTAFQGDSVSLSWVAPRISEEMVEYRVYRDGQLIDTVSDGSTEYTDEDLPGGVFHYSVSAVYDGGGEHLTPHEVDGLIFSGGTGEPNDPYQIALAEQLVAIADFPALADESLVLISNIDLDPKRTQEAAFEQPVIPCLSGTLDGDGFVISNLTSRGFGHLGLIGTLEEGGVVHNLGVVDANVAGKEDHIGILVAYNHGTVSYSYSTGKVSGTDYVGGLVGYNYGDVTDCHSTGTVTGNWSVGGLVGYNYRRIMSSCSTGSVTGGSSVGGLVGYNYEGTVTSCYSTGSVGGNEDVGGLIGFNFSRTITSCYSTGSVSGYGDVGGLVGANDGSITSCFWNMETSGSTISDGGVGLTTTEMMDPYMLGLNGFANDPNWILDAGRDYPKLAWEGTPGQVIPKPVIDWLDGQGNEEAPYRIDKADQAILLSRASEVWDKHFILGADIDLDPNLPGGHVFSQAVIQVFSGVFDGNDHTISHLTIRGMNRVGMFGETGPGARILNLALEAVDVNGTGWSVGGLVGSNYGSITSCSSAGSVSGKRDVGGLVGWNADGSISASYSTGTVTGGRDGGGGIGGLVGSNYGSITTSYSNGGITGALTYSSDGYAIGGSLVGGLVGSNYGSITTSYSNGYAIGGYLVGGLVGRNSEGSISASYSTGTVNGDGRCIGGLVGYNYRGTITSCYSTGIVNGEAGYIGGLVGRNRSSTLGNAAITASFWDTQTSGRTEMCGTQEEGATGCDDSHGKTTARMQMESTFSDAGWDFIDETVNGTDDIWWIDEGVDYPRLWWESIEDE